MADHVEAESKKDSNVLVERRRVVVVSLWALLLVLTGCYAAACVAGAGGLSTALLIQSVWIVATLGAVASLASNGRGRVGAAASQSGSENATTRAYALSETEANVLGLLLAGHTEPEIARMTNRTERLIGHTVRRLKQRFTTPNDEA